MFNITVRVTIRTMLAPPFKWCHCIPKRRRNTFFLEILRKATCFAFNNPHCVDDNLDPLGFVMRCTVREFSRDALTGLNC